MYTLHSYETSKQLVMSYNIEIFNNENLKKESEVIMKKKNIKNLEVRQRTTLILLLGIQLYKALQSKSFFYFKNLVLTK